MKEENSGKSENQLENNQLFFHSSNPSSLRKGIISGNEEDESSEISILSIFDRSGSIFKVLL